MSKDKLTKEKIVKQKLDDQVNSRKNKIERQNIKL